MSFERVERQIAMLREYPTIDVGEMALRRDAADTMQAMLDVVRAADAITKNAEVRSAWDRYARVPRAYTTEAHYALDKLREMTDEK